MTLIEGFIRNQVFIDFCCEVMYGDDQVYTSSKKEYPQ